MDAALTIALARVVLSAGAWNSLAGIASLIYYDSAHDETLTLDAGFRAFAAETEPLTVPDGSVPSGRRMVLHGSSALRGSTWK